jgi:uncharacterized protein YkwD
MKHIFSLTLVLSFLSFREAPRPEYVATPGHTPHIAYTTSDAYGRMANDVLGYVNDYRRKKGLPALTMNSIISAQAQKHSDNMASHRTAFGHNGFSKRMKNISSQIRSVGATAENVAFGSRTAKEVVEDWLHSPGHRENIEGPYNLTGIGIAADNKGHLYFTQIFAKN